MSSSTLFQTDLSGILLAASSSTSNAQPILSLSSNDNNIQSAAQQLLAKYSSFQEIKPGVVWDNMNTGSVAQLVATAFTTVAGQQLGMLNIFSIQHNALYARLDDAVDLGCTAAIFSCIIAGAIILSAKHRLESGPIGMTSKPSDDVRHPEVVNYEVQALVHALEVKSLPDSS